LLPVAARGADNRHRGADQWLFIVAGTGIAMVEGRRVPLKAGKLLVIERGERHEVRNTGRTLLKTLNFYPPPAFDGDGESMDAGCKQFQSTLKVRICRLGQAKP